MPESPVFQTFFSIKYSELKKYLIEGRTGHYKHGARPQYKTCAPAQARREGIASILEAIPS